MLGKKLPVWSGVKEGGGGWGGEVREDLVHAGLVEHRERVWIPILKPCKTIGGF